MLTLLRRFNEVATQNDTPPEKPAKRGQQAAHAITATPTAPLNTVCRWGEREREREKQDEMGLAGGCKREKERGRESAAGGRQEIGRAHV